MSNFYFIKRSDHLPCTIGNKVSRGAMTLGMAQKQLRKIPEDDRIYFTILPVKYKEVTR